MYIIKGGPSLEKNWSDCYKHTMWAVADSWQLTKNMLLSFAVEIDLFIVYKIKSSKMAFGRPYIGWELFHQSSLSSLFLFHQSENFDVKVNSIADEHSYQKTIFVWNKNKINVSCIIWHFMSFEILCHLTFHVMCIQTSQELRMLSSVTINCQVTKIVSNSSSQLSEL